MDEWDRKGEAVDFLNNYCVIEGHQDDVVINCPYCEYAYKLDSVAAEWIFDETVEIGDNEVAFGAVIHPDQKQLSFDVVASPVITKEYMDKSIDIKYCPMCGRKL